MSFASIVLANVVYYNLFSHLSPLELARLCKTSRDVRFAVNDYIQSVYNPHRLLSPFFRDVSSFRSLQARTGSLISGHSALHFFNRSLRPTDPLDVYVYFHHRREVVDWLLDSGFRFSPSITQASGLDYAVEQGRRMQNETYPPDSWECLIFYRDGSHRNATVRVYIAMRSPMEMILHSHSTCMMNVISYEKAYCLFPRPTLHEHRGLLMKIKQGHDVWRVYEIEDVQARGFAMLDGLEPKELALSCASSSFALGWRWIDDSASWVIHFDTHDIPPPPVRRTNSSALTHDPITVCGFSMRYDMETKARIDYELLEDASLDKRDVFVGKRFTTLVHPEDQDFVTKEMPVVGSSISGSIAGIRCLTPEQIRDVLGSSTLSPGVQENITATPYGRVNVAVNQLTVDLILCFVHSLDDLRTGENAQQIVDPCGADDFNASEVEALQRQLRICVPVRGYASHAFQLFTIRDGRRTLASVWPPYTLWSTDCDALSKQVQNVPLDDLRGLQAPTGCTQQMLVETCTPSGYAYGRAVVVPHGRAVLVCHEFYIGITLKSTSSLALVHALSNGK
ncbi:hypothetical protein VTO73DRAFT_15132 [Trametes versicolor]